MRNSAFGLLLAILALLLTACGSDNDVPSETPVSIPSVQTATPRPTLVPPTPIDVAEQSAVWWTVSGFGTLKLAPPSIGAFTHELQEADRLAAWFEFLSDSQLVDRGSKQPLMHLCANGSVISTEDDVVRNYDGSTLKIRNGEVNWRVRTFDPADGFSRRGVMPNSIVVEVRSGFNKTNMFLTAHDGFVWDAVEAWNLTANGDNSELHQQNGSSWLAVNSQECA